MSGPFFLLVNFFYYEGEYSYVNTVTQIHAHNAHRELASPDSCRDHFFVGEFFYYEGEYSYVNTVTQIHAHNAHRELASPDSCRDHFLLVNSFTTRVNTHT